ncbi:MAG: PrsW family intramembrane metalloprotease [Clostridia bacterium]|nr:PrsW family intramembrane metalloprotease [Clostridia bacterium]
MDWILMAVALLPAIFLCGYVFWKDRVEKEPIGLLLKLLILGALCCYPAALIEQLISAVIDGFFATIPMVITSQGVNSYTTAYYIYQFVSYFIGVALVEEGLKFIVLTWTTRKNEAFNSFFDGLIYAVFVSLGFAALENVMYAFSYGLETALMRAVTTVPGHLFFAVLMGYHYSHWHLKDQARDTEIRLKKQGILASQKPLFDSKTSRIYCLWVPVLAHGLYDFLCVVDTTWAFLGLVAFLGFMYVHCFRKIRRMSQNDQTEQTYVEKMLQMKYPGLSFCEATDMETVN